MKDGQTKPHRRLPALVAGLFLAWAAHPAFGISIFKYADCEELCGKGFWSTASAEDVAAALADKPKARPFLRTMLWLAVKAENLAAVTALLRAGAPLHLSAKETRLRPGSMPDLAQPPFRYRGDYLLHEAARRDGKLVSALLKGGAIPNVIDHDRTSPLHEAVRWGRTGAVAALIEAGADPRAWDMDGATAVDLTYLQDHEETGELFDEKTRDMIEDMHEAGVTPPCHRCREEVRPLLLALPPPPRCGRLCDAGFWMTATAAGVRSALLVSPAAAKARPYDGGPLHAALAAGADPEFVRILLDGGVNPNGRDIRDDTPLHVAARSRAGPNAVRLLLERGAIVEARNAANRTPLHAASERAATIENMRALLDAGADPDASTGYPYETTPRHLAARYAEGPAAAAAIIGHGGTKKIRRALPRMLSEAAGAGHPDTVRLLIERGREKKYSDAAFDSELLFVEALDAAIDGPAIDSALLYAASAPNLETMRELLKHGADPNQRGWLITEGLGDPGERHPPLRVAVEHPAAVALLLEAGANPNRKVLGTDGMTPLLFAALECENASLSLMLEHGADPDLQDEDGWTALHYTISRISNEGDDEVRHKCRANLATLIRFSADPGIGGTVRGRNGVTPVDMARQRGLDKFIVEMMEDALPQGGR